MTNPSIPTPSLEALQPFMQPYVRLAQRNMQLFTSFSASPEMVKLWLQNTQKMAAHAATSATSGKTATAPEQMVKQVQENISDVGQSRAFAGLIQGLMQSHMQFLVDLAQTSMAAMSQMPAKVLENVQQNASQALSEAVPVGTHSRHSRRKEH